MVQEIVHSLNAKIENADPYNLEWMDELMYIRFGRRAHDSNAKSIYLKIAPYGEAISPLVHEFTHRLDRNLYQARFQIAEIGLKKHGFTKGFDRKRPNFSEHPQHPIKP